MVLNLAYQGHFDGALVSVAFDHQHPAAEVVPLTVLGMRCPFEGTCGQVNVGVYKPSTC